MNRDSINLYPEMNEKIVGILRIGDNPADLYAAELIEQLTADLAAMTVERDEWQRRSEAAERDMQMAGWGNNCEVCAYFDEPDENSHCNACDGDPGHSGFEWRGLVEGGPVEGGEAL